MTFPSILLVGLALGGFVATILAVHAFHQFQVRRRKQEGAGLTPQAKGNQAVSIVVEIASYLLAPALMFALSGAFPTTFFVVAAIFATFAIATSWAIRKVSGVDRDMDDGDLLLLQSVGAFQTGQVVVGCSAVLVGLAASAAFLFFGYQTAARVDLNSAEGLFEVSMWLFFWPTLANLAAGMFSQSWSLASTATPRQVRNFFFSSTVRKFPIAVWSMSYPFFAFQQVWLAANPSFAALAVVGIAAFYLLTVIAPFEMGRLRFARKEREALDSLKAIADRLSIATDPTVSEGYRNVTIAAAITSMNSHNTAIFAACPMAKSYATSAEKALAEAKTPGLEHEEDPWRRLARLDYRFFATRQMTQMLSNAGSPNDLRGYALETERGAARRLSRQESKSILVATIGIVLTTLVPLLQREFDDEIHIAMDATAAYVRVLGNSLPGASGPQ